MVSHCAWICYGSIYRPMPVFQLRLPSKRRLRVYAALVVLVVGSAGVWWKWPEFGSNLFAEVVGIMLATLLIDRLIAAEEDERRRPARLAAFRDAMELSHETREFVFGLARASVPVEELERIKKESGPLPGLWLADYLGRFEKTDPAPYGGPDPQWQNMRTWAGALPILAHRLRELLDRFMQRHTAQADPELTEVIQDMEENAIFRTLSYGTELFWMLPRRMETG